LGLSPGLVTVHPALAGLDGSDSLWESSLLACHAALAAYICHRPVKLILSPGERLSCSPHRVFSAIRIGSGLDANGAIVSRNIAVRVDAGSGGVFAKEMLDRVCMGALGIYKQNHFSLSGLALASKGPPRRPFAAFGAAEGFFASERHASIIADTLGIDPLQWRIQNNLTKKDALGLFSGNNPLFTDAGSNDTVLHLAATQSDYHRKWAAYQLLREAYRQDKPEHDGKKRRGIGIAACFQGSGFLHPGEGNSRSLCRVELTLEKDGSLEIKTSAALSSPNDEKMWRQIAADILSVEEVRIIRDSKAAYPDAGPLCLSRNITVLTRLVVNACTAIRNRRFRNPLPIKVVRSSRPLLSEGWDGEHIDRNALNRLSWAAAVVELEVDCITCEPLVRGLTLAVAAGRIISEKDARLSLERGSLRALEWAAGCNGVMAPDELPPLQIVFVPSDSLLSEGIGELPSCCIPAAYVQALSQAFDYPFKEIPLNPERMWNILHQDAAALSGEEQ
jgi:CO/xanthine dehydrogenase Mo-binding subunit